MKVESMWASAPRMGRWDLSAHRRWLLILGPAAGEKKSVIFHNSSSYKTHLIKLYANDVELEVFGSEFLEGSSSTVGALSWTFIYTISTHFFRDAWIYKKLILNSRGKDCTRIRQAVSQPSAVYGYPLHVLHLAVILSLLIITTILHGFRSQDMLSDITLPLLLALWWQKQDLVAQKKWSRQLKSMLQQLFALNQFSWLLILWKSNLILNRWCGSEKEIASEFYIIPLLKKKTLPFWHQSNWVSCALMVH